ncbi:MAG: AAA family ATPase [Candidatus Promineifilaceae bacterium]
MKLLSLTIDKYKILRDVTLRFDRPQRLDMGAYALDFLVGLNGSGKSTLLRALTQIVTDLHANRPTPFNYRIEYELMLQQRSVRVMVVRSVPKTEMTVWQDGQVHPVHQDMVQQSYLPKRVVVYTTGRLTMWEALVAQMTQDVQWNSADPDLLNDPVQRAIAELPGHQTTLDNTEQQQNIQSPLLLLREDRLPLMALTGLLVGIEGEDTSLLAEVLNSLRIKRLCGFSLKLRLHRALSNDELFQNIKGVATRHVQQGSDHLLVFDMADEASKRRKFVKQLWAGYPTPLDFYEALDKLSEPIATGEPTLQEINLFLERDIVETEDDEVEATRVLLFDWLSDGEKSFFGRMAMLAMLQTNNSLILLDEPEVHFNDYWKRRIVKLIDNVMTGHPNHLLIVSHSSIGLSDVAAAQVQVMSEGPDGFTRVDPPAVRTLGTDPSEIMIVVFHTKLSTGKYAADLLKTVVENGERQELENFLDKVGPGMWYFRILQRLEALDAPSA